MRIALVFGFVALVFPIAAGAQSDNAKGRASDQRITKEEYVERAKQRAIKRFDKLDTNHDGVLTAEERRAGRHRRSSQEKQPEE